MFRGRFPFEHVAAQYFFETGNQVQSALHRFKYDGMTEVGDFMGNEMGMSLAESGWMNEIHLLVPVPLHPRKEAVRGYNQSEVLARSMSLTCNISVEIGLLERAQFNETQTRKKKMDRWSDVQNIFIPGKSVMPAGAHVLLIDDVTTTGSTMEACAHVLREMGAERISLAVAAFALNRS